MKNIIQKNYFGPWALITGASSGIGKEFARQDRGVGNQHRPSGRPEDLL